jgi:histidinol phosphatase-like enzyme
VQCNPAISNRKQEGFNGQEKPLRIEKIFKLVHTPPRWNTDRILLSYRRYHAKIPSGMPEQEELLDVVITIKITETDKKDLRNDLPILNEKLRRSTGFKFDASKVVRAAIRDLHEHLGKGIVPRWVDDREPKSEIGPAKKPGKKKGKI